MTRNLDPDKAREVAAFMTFVNDQLIAYQLGLTPTSACNDPMLLNWLFNAANFAGDFLKDISNGALRADWNNYPLLRPFLLYLKEKYPLYDQTYTGKRPNNVG